MKDWIGDFVQKMQGGFESGRMKEEEAMKRAAEMQKQQEEMRKKLVEQTDKIRKEQDDIVKRNREEQTYQTKSASTELDLLGKFLKLFVPKENINPLVEDVSAKQSEKPTITPAEIQTPSPITPTPTTVQQMMGVGDTGEMLKYYGDSLSKKLERDLPILKANAAKNGMPLEDLLAQWWQESSFGTNPNTGIKNSATALGDMQITDAFTNPNKPAYPKFPELYIAPNDRLNLDKSTDFTSKYYSTMSDYLGSPDKAISSYYGDPSYLELIKKHAKSPQIQSLLEYLKVNQ